MISQYLFKEYYINIIKDLGLLLNLKALEKKVFNNSILMEIKIVHFFHSVRCNKWISYVHNYAFTIFEARYPHRA